MSSGVVSIVLKKKLFLISAIYNSVFSRNTMKIAVGYDPYNEK